MNPLTLLWNERERRPRMPVRIALLIVVTASLGLATSIGVSGLGAVGLGRWVEVVVSETAALVAGVVGSAVVTGGTVTLGVFVTGRYVDRRRLRDFGVRVDRDWWLDYAFGLGLGAGLMALVFLVQLGTGWVEVTGTVQPREGFAVRFVGLTAVFVVIGLYEELLLRGYLLTNVAEGLANQCGKGWAVLGGVVLSSLVFGLGHATNPTATTLSTAAVALGGGMLATGYVLTGELGLPIGLHTTWNLFQGGVFGFPVSGLGVGASVVTIEQSGPRLLTGGDFGPEAGVVGVGAMVLGTAAIAVWARWRTGRLGIDSSVATPELRSADDDGDPEEGTLGRRHRDPAPDDRH
jgi:membrane protease YdiL (CAAX protease family)